MNRSCANCRFIHGKTKVVTNGHFTATTRLCYLLEFRRSVDGPVEEGSLEETAEKRLGGPGRVSIQVDHRCSRWKKPYTVDEVAVKANRQAANRISSIEHGKD